MYNLYESHRSDLIRERLEGRKFFLGYPFWILKRGKKISGNHAVRKFNFRGLQIFNFKLIRSLFLTNSNIYIGYHRSSITQVLDSINVQERYFLTDVNGEIIDTTMHIFKALFLPISFIISLFYRRNKLEIPYINEILFSSFLIRFIRKGKTIHFSGGIPFIAAFKDERFIEIQHGNIHNYYPLLSNLGCFRTKMLVFQNTNCLKLSIRNRIVEIKLATAPNTRLSVDKIGFLTSPVEELNLNVLNFISDIDIIKPHPRDFTKYEGYDLTNDFAIILNCKALVVLPSTVLWELIYIYRYNGRITVLLTTNQSLQHVLEFYNILPEDFDKFKEKYI